MEILKHECGIAMIRLLKPLEYYQQKYGTWMYGLNKLYLLMEKQHNRGQEGAGMACVKLNTAPGSEFMFRERAEGSGAISEIFNTAHSQINKLTAEQIADVEYSKLNAPFAGEMYMGHLRYSTTGRSGLSYVHPFMRRDNYRSRNMVLCGNFNLTNSDQVFDYIVSKGQHPRLYADTFIILEQVGDCLDKEVQRVYNEGRAAGVLDEDMTSYVEDRVCVENILKQTVPMWDGGFCICGMTGSGESFAVRDPWGIRPSFYYIDDEIVVVASERPVIQTVMNLDVEQVKELAPGSAIIVSKDGVPRVSDIVTPKNNSACSFERIYFSRGSDRDIYAERKSLGANLVPDIIKAVDGDLKHSVFSFIPNTAEVAFYGMVHGLNAHLNTLKNRAIRDNKSNLTPEFLDDLLSMAIRTEKVAIKDIKLRTFISEGSSRNELAAHVYDIAYGSINSGEDNLVVIDDSIVRGTTLKQSIIRILSRLNPKKIVIVSSAPQIRYPDFYGIDMPSFEGFIAFIAAVELLRDNGRIALLDEVYAKSKAQENQPSEWIENYVKEIYAPFTAEQISRKIAELLKPEDVDIPVEIIFQSIEGLHRSCPDHPGDWYFSGNYPTPGGNRLVNYAFIRYYEKFILGRK